MRCSDEAASVFALARRGLRLDRISKTISAIGKKAGVVVNKEQGKYAAGHANIATMSIYCHLVDSGKTVGNLFG